MVHNTGEHGNEECCIDSAGFQEDCNEGNEEVCMEDSAEFQEDCIEDCGAEIAKADTCESFYIGEEDPCEE